MSNFYNVIGVMSGTSIDGIDLAQVQFELINKIWTFSIINAKTYSYSNELHNRLLTAIDLPLKDLGKLNNDYTEYLASVISEFISTFNIQNTNFVSSHGHTLLHQPNYQLTLQIGNLPKLAKLIKQTVICDFRVQDVKLGGQGAPLVPIGDRLLFPNYDYCLNLGGFANISFEATTKLRIAFDMCSVNTVLNHYASLLGFVYDDAGELARQGTINQDLLDKLNSLDFYTLNKPKSLGYEFVKSILLPLIDSFETSIECKLRTYVEHASIQIAKSLPTKHGKMLVTGGGAYNSHLIERLRVYLPHMDLIIPDSKIIEFKEALIFAFLGVLRHRNEINVLSSVTGASTDHSSGEIFD
jgi:anhydro-N-acetylmuramic acid kinase